MMHQAFLDTSGSLVASAANHTPGSAQHQSDLRRATSTTYYALFHALLHSNAETLCGPAGNAPFPSEWVAVYRALGHGRVEEKTKRKDWPTFSIPIRSFLDLLKELRTKREEADYNPNGSYTSAEVMQDLTDAQILITTFLSESPAQRRTLAVWLLFSVR